MPTNRPPLTQEQKDALVLRLKIAREAKEKKMAEQHVEKIKKLKAKEKEEIKEAGIEVEEPKAKEPPKVEPKAKEVAPKVVPEQAAPEVEQLKTEIPKVAAKVKSPKKSPKVTKAGKEKYAKLVFYKEPSAKKMKKMQSVLGLSSDSEDEEVVKPPPRAVPQLDLNQQKKLQYEKLSKLAHHFFDC